MQLQNKLKKIPRAEDPDPNEKKLRLTIFFMKTKTTKRYKVKGNQYPFLKKCLYFDCFWQFFLLTKTVNIIER